jgi:hypothetical protein
MTHIIQQNRVSLKNLKVADFASEETLCFSAIVLFDGKPIADARNDGHGGCTFLHPLKDAQPRLSDAEGFAKGLPPVVTEYDDPNDRSGKLTIDVTLDFLVDHIAQETHANRQIRTAFNRDIAGKVFYIRDNRLLFLKGVKLKEVPDKPRLFANLRAKHGPAITILNELPQDEAFVLWKKYAVGGERS